jgi:hypothetical protein
MFFSWLLLLTGLTGEKYRKSGGLSRKMNILFPALTFLQRQRTVPVQVCWPSLKLSVAPGANGNILGPPDRQ